MTPDPRTARLAVIAAAVSVALAACGGTGGTDTAGLPTADDLGAGAEQPTDPAQDGDAPTTSGMCAADHPDCDDMIEPGEDEAAGGGAAGSCLAGDPDCTDESYGGQDAARPVPLSDEPSGAEPAAHGATSGATARQVEHAHLLDEDTLELTVGGNPCMLVEDVVVEESPTEVRVLVLGGQDASTEACIESYVQFAVQVDLEQPLGDRTLLDLAG